jgi:hypothetical protein
LSSDGNNCGSCGRTCEGGACGNGVCAPTPLLTNEFNVQALVLDQVNVYWTQGGATNGALKQLSLLGASMPTILGSGIDNPTDIATNGVGDVFCLASDQAANQWNVWQAQANFALSGKHLYTNAQSGVAFGIGADSSQVYYSVRSSYGNADYAIMAMVKGGGPPTTLASGSSSRVLNLALGPNEIVFQDQVSGRIYSVQKSGGALLTLGSGWNNLGPWLTVAGGYAFWADQEGLTLADGGTAMAPQIVRGTLGSPGTGLPFFRITDLNSLSTDGSQIFYTEGPEGYVGTFSFTAQFLPTVASGRTGFPSLVGANAKYVVWYEANAGTIYKLVR